MEAQLTESQFNDILRDMWMVGISPEGMVFYIHEAFWDKLQDWKTLSNKKLYPARKSQRTIIYDSDFGAVLIKKVA